MGGLFIAWEERGVLCLELITPDRGLADGERVADLDVELARSATQPVLVNLAAAGYVASAAIGALIRIANERTHYVVGISTGLREVLEVIEALQLFTIGESWSDALDKLAQS